jgi:hypothetical protein
MGPTDYAVVLEDTGAGDTPYLVGIAQQLAAGLCSRPLGQRCLAACRKMLCLVGEAWLHCLHFSAQAA